MDLPEWDPFDFNSSDFQNDMIFPYIDAIPSSDLPADDLFSVGMYFDFQPSPELPEMEALPLESVKAPWPLDRNGQVMEEQGTLQNNESSTGTSQYRIQQEGVSEGRRLPLEQQLEGQGTSTLST